MAKYTIILINRLAKVQGVKCLSKSYKGANSPLTFECKKLHNWKISLRRILARGYWCSACSGRRSRINIGQIKQIAKERGGLCLSESFENINDKLKWQCMKGHRWSATGNNVKNNGSWCPVCAIEKSAKKLRHDISIFKKIAINRGGLCLSEIYKNSLTKLKFKCGNGHIWYAQPHHIKNGSWCNVCSPYLGERITRACFEQLFNKKFPKSKPHWLVNAAKNKMEFDGYCEELKIAFEHQGNYHSELTYQNQYSSIKLNKRKKDDKLKIKLAKENGVKLISVPWVRNEIQIKDLKEFLTVQCKKLAITVPENSIDKIINYDLAYKPDQLFKAIKLAKKNKGRFLSTEYLGSKFKYDWQCNRGHRWSAVISNISSGQWCPKCRGGVALNIEILRQDAIKYGGVCLSNQYKKVSSKLLFKCKAGHEWSATPAMIRRGHWCPHCAGVAKGTIEQMKALAMKHDGECLFKVYVNNNALLKWKCKKGHIWKEKPKSIKLGHWCRTCTSKA